MIPLPCCAVYSIFRAALQRSTVCTLYSCLVPTVCCRRAFSLMVFSGSFLCDHSTDVLSCQLVSVFKRTVSRAGLGS
jgi:hypothetical protein